MNKYFIYKNNRHKFCNIISYEKYYLLENNITKFLFNIYEFITNYTTKSVIINNWHQMFEHISEKVIKYFKAFAEGMKISDSVDTMLKIVYCKFCVLLKL